MLALIDARRGEVFAALYESGEELWEPFAATPADLVERVQGAGLDPLAVGDGSVRFREELETSGIRVAPAESGSHVVSALQVCRLAAGTPGSGAGGRPTALPTSPRRKASMNDLEIRRLTYADLPHVIAIERRAFPTPWSLAMFVLELSKPSGICLAAVSEDQLVGYVVCSRYDTVWHLMNVAVDDQLLRRGIARVAAHPAVRAGRPPEHAVHARGQDLERRRHPALRGLRLPGRGAPARLLPRQQRGRPDHVAHRAGARHRLILGDRDELRRHLRRRRHRRRRGALERDRLPGAAPRALRRRGAGAGRAPPSGAGGRGDGRRARARRASSSATWSAWR